MENKKLTLCYIESTSKYIKKLREGYSYDDSSGCMVENSLLLQILNATQYNFRLMSSFGVMVILKKYILGFERITPSDADIDAIKYVVCELANY